VLRVFLLAILAVSLFYTTLTAYQTVRSGLQLGFAWPLLLRTFAYPLYFSIPIAFLFATTLAIGRLVSDLEVMALRSHGISHLQIYVPSLALGLVLAAASLYLNGWVVPDIHFQRRNIEAYVLDQLENLGSGWNRTILLPDGEGTLWVGAFDGTRLKRVMVDLHTNQESSLVPALREHLPDKLPSKVTVVAKEGRIDLDKERKVVILDLKSVEVLVPEPVRGAAIANDFFHQTITIAENVVIPLTVGHKRRGIKDKTLPELLHQAAELKGELARTPAVVREPAPAPHGPEPGVAFAAHRTEAAGERRQKLERRIAATSTEIHRRLSFTLSSLTFPLVGVSLSLILQRWSRLVPFFAGNLVVIGLYYPLLMLGRALGERGFFPPVAMALPNAALLILGVLLFRKVLRQ
jgi:lipopolysaccharide export LptBFGC system permease protein LptF